MKSHPPACVSIPDVTIEDHDAFLDLAHHALSDLILSARLSASNSRLPWAPLASYPSQTKVYTANDPLVRDAFFAGETTLEMALEDAIAFFRVDERAEYLDHARLLARKASNACILSPLSSGSCDDPYHYVGLHWLALPPSSSSLFHQRDICYLEAHDAFHLHGARGWACVASSVRLPWFPCLEMSHQLLRATMRQSGYVLTELGPTTTRVVHVVNVDMGGHIPSVLVAKMLKAQAASVAQLAHRIRTRGTTVVSPPSTHCASCHAKFHCLKTKVECHRCGDMVCKRCILVNAQCKNCCYGHPDRVRASTSPDNKVGHRQTSSSTVIAEEDNEGSDDDLSALRVGAEAQPLRRTVVEGRRFDCHVSVVSGYSI